MKGKFVTVYIPEHLLNKWSAIGNKSKLVQEAVENAEGQESTQRNSKKEV